MNFNFDELQFLNYRCIAMVKSVKFDLSSLLLAKGEKVNIKMAGNEEAPEEFEASYVGTHQLKNYSLPFHLFAVEEGEEVKVRMINPNFIREIRHSLSFPNAAEAIAAIKAPDIQEYDSHY